MRRGAWGVGRSLWTACSLLPLWDAASAAGGKQRRKPQPHRVARGKCSRVRQNVGDGPFGHLLGEGGYERATEMRGG